MRYCFEMDELKLNEKGIVDTYITTFYVLNFTVRVSDEKVGISLSKLSERQRAFILLYYYRNMSDREFSELYHIFRSAIGYTRNKGLRKLEELMRERR